jgi:hypothetical protein
MQKKLKSNIIITKNIIDIIIEQLNLITYAKLIKKKEQN